MGAFLPASLHGLYFVFICVLLSSSYNHDIPIVFGLTILNLFSLYFLFKTPVSFSKALGFKASKHEF